MENHAGRNVVNPNEAVKLVSHLKGGGQVQVDARPEVFLPGGANPIRDAALTLGRLIARDRLYYYRGGAVVRIMLEDDDRKPTLVPVKAAALPTAFERVARLVKAKQIDGEWKSEPTIFTEQACKQILESDDFRECLPVLRVVARCPVLIERDGELVEISGYDRKSGIFAVGEPAERVDLETAKDLLFGVLDEFKFATSADQSRALAALIAPALVLGGMLHGRAPLDLGEADQSQTGKGYRNKLTAAIYGQKVRTVTQQQSGVGGMEESFDAALINGDNFVCLDNIRGKINSCKIELFLTEESYPARVPYQPVVNIDPTRTFVMMTSNNADVTTDLANRSCCVRLLRRSSGHEFNEFPEGDILDHVRAHQPRYLGAVFAVIRQWYRDGKPRTKETQHSFRAWVQKLDYIVQTYLDAPPLMQGHRATQERMTNPTLQWFREVVLAMRQYGHCGAWMRTGEIVDILSETEVRLPGMREHDVLSEDIVRKRVLQAVGRNFSKSFRKEDEIDIDGHITRRRMYTDPMSSQQRREYFFVGEEEQTEVPF